MAKITGLGGVFLKMADGKKLLEFYRDVLELDVSEYGINFLHQSNPVLITFDRGDNDAVLNFAVDDIENYIKKLAEKGVEIHKEIQSYDFGRFAQIKDSAGNIIELCQLNEAEYAKMVEKEVSEFKK